MNQATTEPFYPAQVCVFQANMANERYVMNSAIWHLGQWINGGTPPPSAPAPITVVANVIQRDAYNNALGGIRLPELDVPTRTLQGVGNTANPPNPLSFCVLYGRTVPPGSKCVDGTNPGVVCIANSQCLGGGTCQAVPLSSLYSSHDDYVTEYTNAANSQVADGFILPVDAAEAITAARANCQGWPDGTPCDDGNACTQPDQCTNGQCVSGPALCSLSPAKIWVGLKNSDDVGTKFDLRAEIYKGSSLIGSGQLNSVAGGSSGFNNAKLASIPLTLFAPVGWPTGSTLGIKLYVRNTCSGSTHNSGTARLWYDAAAANTQFGATIGSASNTYFLLKGSRWGLFPGPDQRRRST